MREAIIVAAGRGRRMGNSLPKQFLELGGKPVLVHSVQRFLKESSFAQVIVVVPQGYLEYSYQQVLGPWLNLENLVVVEGAAERQESVFHGLMVCGKDCKSVCIHDGARPLVSSNQIKEVTEAGENYGAATLAVPLQDTLKEIDETGWVVRTLPRDRYRLIQTPQCFNVPLLWRAHNMAKQEGLSVTDDASMLEFIGETVKTVSGSYRNLKITTPEDLALAEVLLELEMNN